MLRITVLIGFMPARALLYDIMFTVCARASSPRSDRTMNPVLYIGNLIILTIADHEI